MKAHSGSLPYFQLHVADLTTARGFVKVAADDAALAALLRFMLHSWVHGPVSDAELEDVCGPGFDLLRRSMLDFSDGAWVLTLLEIRRTEQDAERATNKRNAELGHQRRKAREQAEAERADVRASEGDATASDRMRPHSDRLRPLATPCQERRGEQRREGSGACTPTAIPGVSGISASDAAEVFPAPQVLRDPEAEREPIANGQAHSEAPGISTEQPRPPRPAPLEVEAVPDDGSADPPTPARKRSGGGNAMTRHWDAEWARLRPDHGPFPWTNGHAAALARCAKFPGSSPEEVCRRITRLLASQDGFHLRTATPQVLQSVWANLPADVVRPMTERERILSTPIPEYPRP